MISSEAKSSSYTLLLLSLPFILFSSFIQLLPKDLATLAIFKRLGNFSNIYICMSPLSFQSIFTIIMSVELETEPYLCEIGLCNWPGKQNCFEMLYFKTI